LFLYFYIFISYWRGCIDISEIIEIEIKNDKYGDIRDIKIFITSELKSELQKIKAKKYDNLFTSLINSGFKGGKHLIEILRDKLGKNIIVILSHEKSRIEGNKVIINYNNYIKIGYGAFFEVYRQAGIDTAFNFLSKELPEIAPDLSETITKSQTEKVIKSLPKTKKLTTKSQNLLLFNLAELIKKTDRKKLSSDALIEIKAASNQAYYENKLDEFRERLKKRYYETKGKYSWQNWIYSHYWIFGIYYLEPIPKEDVGFKQIPDFLFPTIDGFIDILEIKVPNKLEKNILKDIEIIKKDENHTGSYYWSRETSEAIGQVTNYIDELEKHQLEIADIIRKKYKDKYPIEISAVKPRAFILIGRTEKWDKDELEALRKLNSTLHRIEIISYDQLLKRGESMINLFDREIDTKKLNKNNLGIDDEK